MWILMSFSLEFFVVLWVVRDARDRGRIPCFDFGFLVLVGFPLSVAWYLFSTRGWRGLIILGVFVALYLIPWLCAAALWIVISILWE